MFGVPFESIINVAWNNELSVVPRVGGLQNDGASHR